MKLGILIILIRLFPFLILGEHVVFSDKPLVRTTEGVLFNHLQPGQLSYEAFYLAYNGFQQIKNKYLLQNDSLLTVIDYSLPSDQKRLWIIDIKNDTILENTLVAHGKASGVVLPKSFSDTPQSHQSSLGFYITGNTYTGKHGYSLTMDGLEEGINQNARQRAIVFHGANYVSTTFIEKTGRLGRSFGCPALPPEQSQHIIDLIKDNSCVFIYFPDPAYLRHSKFIAPSYLSQKSH
jgi:hypothetical protein